MPASQLQKLEQLAQQMKVPCLQPPAPSVAAAVAAASATAATGGQPPEDSAGTQEGGLLCAALGPLQLGDAPVVDATWCVHASACCELVTQHGKQSLLNSMSLAVTCLTVARSMRMCACCTPSTRLPHSRQVSMHSLFEKRCAR
jgi:hypothetical protein